MFGLGLDPASTTLSLLSTWVQPGKYPDREEGLVLAAGKRNCRCCNLNGTQIGVRSEQSTDLHNKQNHSSIKLLKESDPVPRYTLNTELFTKTGDKTIDEKKVHDLG
jgi:hypothetical protein